VDRNLCDCAPINYLHNLVLFNHLAISNDAFSLLQCKKHEAKSEGGKQLEMQVSIEILASTT